MLRLTYNLSLIKSDFIKSSLLTCLIGFSGLIQAEIRIQDSLGEQVFETVPTRVVTLSWGLTESVIELGITPVASGDVKGYKEWVKRPTIPATTEDIGTREEPNLAKLVQLKPDVILIGSSLKDMTSRLKTIAPVVVFDTYKAGCNNEKTRSNALKPN